MVHDKDDGYEHVYEYIPIGTPTAETISKLSAIKPGDDHGDRKEASHTLLIPLLRSYLITSHRRSDCRNRDTSTIPHQQKDVDAKDGSAHRRGKSD